MRRTMTQSFRGISLRQIVEDDMPFIFRLFADPLCCHLWMRGRQVYDEAGFHHAWGSWTGARSPPSDSTGSCASCELNSGGNHVPSWPTCPTLRKTCNNPASWSALRDGVAVV